MLFKVIMMLLANDKDIWIPKEVLKPFWHGNTNKMQDKSIMSEV